MPLASSIYPDGTPMQPDDPLFKKAQATAALAAGSTRNAGAAQTASLAPAVPAVPATPPAPDLPTGVSLGRSIRSGLATARDVGVGTANAAMDNLTYPARRIANAVGNTISGVFGGTGTSFNPTPYEDGTNPAAAPAAVPVAAVVPPSAPTSAARPATAAPSQLPGLGADGYTPPTTPAIAPAPARPFNMPGLNGNIPNTDGYGNATGDSTPGTQATTGAKPQAVPGVTYTRGANGQNVYAATGASVAAATAPQGAASPPVGAPPVPTPTQTPPVAGAPPIATMSPGLANTINPAAGQPPASPSGSTPIPITSQPASASTQAAASDFHSPMDPTQGQFQNRGQSFSAPTTNLSGDTTGTERERQKAIGDIGSQIFALGTIDSNGKRQILSELMHERAALGQAGYDRASKFAETGASLNQQGADAAMGDTARSGDTAMTANTQLADTNSRNAAALALENNKPFADSSGALFTRGPDGTAKPVKDSSGKQVNGAKDTALLQTLIRSRDAARASGETADPALEAQIKHVSGYLGLPTEGAASNNGAGLPYEQFAAAVRAKNQNATDDQIKAIYTKVNGGAQ